MDVQIPERPVALHRRTYLFAIPEKEAEFSCDRLADALGETQALVDWEPSSQRRGLRYVEQSESLPPAVSEFTSEEARAEWAGWSAREKQERAMIARAARMEASRAARAEREVE
ncbi:hypothetical protein [Tranquillimonas alkanivorans]|uniref:hypothetical protein n=1 Tax=Tranquillimonas alkanivorans TaxID=441119 RepID=UPI00116013D9|nr:hypothetical protein [Tranquillimonas alkanivorans]